MRHLLNPTSLVATLAVLPGLHATDPVRLTTAHVDIRIVDRPGQSNRLDLRVVDEDAGISHPTTNVVLVVPTAARIAIPEGFEVFGQAGAPLWILPQSQESGLPYLGISAEGLPGNTFESRFDIELVGVDGPGHFFLWQFDTFSNLVMAMNSRDGVDATDRARPLAGGHEHFNWGFTATGYHEVFLRVSNRLLHSTNVVSSEVVPIRFGVEPFTIPSPALAATLQATPNPDGSVQVRLSGSPSRTYPLQASTNLTDWVSQGSIATDSSGSGSQSLPTAAEHQFFRALTP